MAHRQYTSQYKTRIVLEVLQGVLLDERRSIGDAAPTAARFCCLWSGYALPPAAKSIPCPNEP